MTNSSACARRTCTISALLLLCMLSISFAALCPVAERTIQVPAVVTNQEGGLLQIRASTQPGGGDILTTVEPVVGPSTQQSQAMAVKEAFRGLDINPDLCETHFYVMDTQGAPSVDGPSAGLAMTMALRGALTNQTIRSDVSVTGAILPDGRAGDVGGLIDKAQASARRGMHALITPHQELYENIILQRLGQERNFSVVEVRTLDEAMAVAASPDNQPIMPIYHLENKPIPVGLAPWPQNEQDNQFEQVAARLNDMLRARLQEGGIFAKSGYGEYFQRVLDDNARLTGMGYGYASANNAFLAQVDAAFLSLPAHTPDVSGEADRVLQCVRRTPSVNLTRENFEWVAGGSARVAWSLQKIEDVKKNLAKETSSEEQYMALRDVYSAQAWCDAGTQLLLIAQETGGHAVNDSALAELARARVQAQEQNIAQLGAQDSDMAWHAQIANRSLMRHQWAAALFDAAYVEGSLDAVQVMEQNGTLGAQALQTPMQGLWGRVYGSQAAYLQAGASNDTLTPDALRVWKMARAMETGMDAGKQSMMQAKPGSAGALAGGNPAWGNTPTSAKPSASFNFVDVAVALVVVFGVLTLGYGIGRSVEKFKKTRKK